MTQIGTVIDNKYEILREIGTGGMSVVYLAMDTHLNKQWAVKEIRKKGSNKNDEIVVNSLLAEANMMKRLDHPALPRIVDIIDNGVTIYIVMDYIEGESLDKILARYGPQQEELVIEWAKYLCDVLSYLHAQKPPIIYRDMKPSNIMLKPEGTIKIIDFGIAREYKEQNTMDTTVLGTMGYAPPEQYSGQTDARSDIFALGMTMHHLLTGVDPRGGDAYASVRMYNSQLSEGIERIIDKCVEPVAENRYQNCSDLLYDLQHPQNITMDHRKKQWKKLVIFFLTLLFSLLFLAAGIVCNIAGIRMKNSNYEFLISVSEATSLEDKLESYMQAIAIFPEKTDAYLCMLDAYDTAGQFGREENDQFLAVYNANKDKFDKTSKETAELNYRIGMMYFNCYTETVEGTDLDTTQEYSFLARVQKAYSFFAANSENENIASDFEHKALSDCYYQICTFYKKYILSSSSVKEAMKEEYENLITTVKNTLELVKNAGEEYDQLSIYNGTFILLYDRRSSMVQVDIRQGDVLDLLEKVYMSASELNVWQEKSKKLQNEIIDNYDNYREAIIRAYTNGQERR